MKNYKKQAEDFLTKAKATIKIELAEQQQAPIWHKEGEDYGLMYKITIERKNKKPWKFNLWNSIADKQAINLLETKKPIPLNGKLVWEYEHSYYLARIEHKKRIQAGEFNPNAYDVLACITKHNPGDFENFCSELGFEEDSRTAEKIFMAVIKEWNECERMFGDLREELQNIN